MSDLSEAEFDVGARLREVRLAAGLTQRQLAERAGVPHGQISMIEQNKSSPSVASLRKILSGVPMTMGEFFEPERRHPDKVFFTPAELLDLTSRLYKAEGIEPRGRMTLRQVGDARAHNLQILHEHYEPGADTGETMLEHVAHEGGIVIAGEIEITVGDRRQILKAGDAYLFDSRLPHRFRNVSDRPAEVISACSPPYL
ncbi:cupin domain-containing protein [Benzoatithermus flavus]|uniref:Cupin domain-containing protein n=1 Tax=Benzoatithermus flavus TaxID=3108223 RepID=A0ABU8XSC5_9PROT